MKLDKLLRILTLSLTFVFTIMDTFGTEAIRFTKLFLQEDFESFPFQSSTPFPTGKISGDSPIIWNISVSDSFELVTTPVQSGQYALKVLRNGASGHISVGRKEGIPEGYDFRVSFQLQVPEKGGCTVF
ncbi:MAG: hypothetical protein GX946_05750, partial [Oligosphaeraceae bacterium]|nr:hypothetical protein [Oligosphaeraceae bacterium]